MNPLFGALLVLLSPPDAALRESALAKMAAGDYADAASELRGTRDPDLLCLLARAQMLAGRAKDGARTYAAVPEEAGCAERARFGRADALQAAGRLAEASAEYARLSAPRLGPDRDAATAAWLRKLARRIPKDSRGAAHQVLQEALSLHLAPARRVAIARELGRSILEDEEGRLPDVARRLLTWESAPADRRLLARLVEPRWGLSLLAAGPSDAATALLRAQLAGRVDPEWGARRLADVASHFAKAAEGRTARAALADQLAGAGRASAVEWLTSDIAAAGSRAPRASWALAQLYLRDARLTEAVEALEAHLAKFPADATRTDAESALDAARLELGRRAFAAGRHAEAIGHYDALVSRDPRAQSAPRAAYEAGLAAHLLKDRDAEKRWREVLARWPDDDAAADAVGSLARARLYDGEGLPAALALLDALIEPADEIAALAGEERARLESPALTLDGRERHAPGRDARMRVVTRNVRAIEARLHMVDAEAYMRAGGTPAALPELDVAVVAPDRRWNIDVPRFEAGKDAAFDLTLPEPKAGIYVVTVAAEQREASSVVLVSDLTLVARAVGHDLAVAVFRDGRPVDGARILVRDRGEVSTGRTDGGLYRARVSRGPLTILAEHRGAPALLTLTREDDPVEVGETPEAELAIDLDRPVYRPGDEVRFRLRCRRGGRPLSGDVKVSIAQGPWQRLDTTDLGTAEGVLRVPPVAARIPWAGYTAHSHSIEVLAPGADTPVRVATVKVADPGGPQRRLSIDGARVQVLEADGRPAAGVALVVDGQHGPAPATTDDAGRARLPAPPPGHPWTTRAQLSMPALVADWSRSLPDRPALGLSAHVTDRVRLALTGRTGPAHLSVARVTDSPDVAPPPSEPWIPAVRLGVEGPIMWRDAPAPRSSGGERRVWQTALSGENAGSPEGRQTVEVPALEPGRYVARLVAEDGRAASAVTRFEVRSGGLRLEGTRDAAAGEALPIRAPGGPSLLTVEGVRLSDGAGREPGLLAATVGGRLDLRVRPEWHGPAVVTAVGPDGVVVRDAIQLDGRLRVDLAVDSTGPRWTVRARVTDGAGRPAAAEVLLTASDEHLERTAGLAAAVEPFADVALEHQAGGVAHRWSHAAAGRPVAAALQREAARQDEARLARRARTGELGLNAVAEAFAQDAVPLEFGGLGLSGSGSGGGGAGLGGLGNFGPRVRAGHASVTGVPRHDGLRGPAPWRVLRTDADGVAELVADWPRGIARWRVTARALTAQAFGEASVRVDTSARVRLVLAAPGPGRPGDTAALRTTVVNGGESVARVRLAAGKGAHPLTLAAGEARTVDLGTQRPGDAVAVQLLSADAASGGRLLDAVDWRWPIQPTHEVTTVAVDPGGGLPLAWWALADDPEAMFDATRCARAGRAALAAAPHTAGVTRARLIARAQDARAALRIMSASGNAEALLFLGEAREPLGVTRGEIERWASLPAPGPSPARRVLALHARAAAGLDIDEASVARLRRNADELPAEVAARLVRVLRVLGREEAAASVGAVLKADGGPQTVLARRALRRPDKAGRAALLAGHPPKVGTAERADWIAAVGVPAGARRGAATIRLGDRVVGRIDLRTGGHLHLHRPETPPSVDGASEAWVGAGSAAPRSGTGHGRLLRVPAPLSHAGRLDLSSPEARVGAVLCGHQEPCRVATGDAVLLEGRLDAPGWTPPAGFVLETDAHTGTRWLRATTPGRFWLAGMPLGEGFAEGRWVEVVDGLAAPGQVSQGYAVALAEAEQPTKRAPDGAGADPWLAAWPDDADWRPELVGRVARLRFLRAVAGDDEQAVVDRFEALRDAWPAANLEFAHVARVADAYQALGAHARTTAVWRAGLGAAFLGEAAAARRIEGVAGPLASLQGLRALAARHPYIPQVQEALFHLPQRLGSMADEDLSEQVTKAGITATDLRLMAAAWDREFLAEWPEGKRRLEVGFHLVRTLLQLDADARAASWAGLLAAARSPLQDGFLYLQGLARARLREDGAALDLFERVGRDEFLLADGTIGPAPTRGDARYAAARLYEARGETERARAAYAAVSQSHPEAERARVALSEVVLRPEPLYRVRPGEPTRLEVRLANVPAVNVRAYRLDLRTLFLRDGGLSGARQVKVSGVSPAWSGTIGTRADPFPGEQRLSLPLKKPGAYLVQLDGAGRQAVTLLVVSDLALAAESDGDTNRVRVRRRGEPARGVELRAIGGGEVSVARTDLRGVAFVPADAQILAFDGEHYAFTEPSSVASNRPPRRPSPRQKKGFGEGIEQRLQEQLMRNSEAYESTFGTDEVNSIDAAELF